MRLMGILLAGLMLATGSLTESGAGGVATETSVGEEPLSRFFSAVRDYYRIPQWEVMMIRERGIPPCEIPVVLFIAKKAHVAPEIIIDFRLRDNAWLYTTFRFGLGPEIFYIPVDMAVKDSPYRKAYKGYRDKPKKKWKTIELSDDDIINLVNLKLMSDYYAYPPEKIIKMRSGGKEFFAINDQIRKEKERMKDHREREDGVKRELARGKKEIER